MQVQVHLTDIKPIKVSKFKGNEKSSDERPDERPCYINTAKCATNNFVTIYIYALFFAMHEKTNLIKI